MYRNLWSILEWKISPKIGGTNFLASDLAMDYSCQLRMLVREDAASQFLEVSICHDDGILKIVVSCLIEWNYALETLKLTGHVVPQFTSHWLTFSTSVAIFTLSLWSDLPSRKDKMVVINVDTIRKVNLSVYICLWVFLFN